MPDNAARPFRRVLLSAYACHPTTGSEPGVGWEFLRAALELSDEVWLLTRPKNERPVLDALPDVDRARVHVVGHDLSATAQRLKHLVPVGTQLYYVQWQRTAVARVRAAHADSPFDLGHHVTFGSDWMPAALCLQDDFPVVLGPVGGSTRPPARLWRFLGVRGAAVETVRLVASSLGRAAVGNAAARRAALLLAYNDDERGTVGRGADRLVVESTAMMDPHRPRSADEADPGLIVGVGRLLPWKGWTIAIDALDQLPASWRLVLLGRGPDARRLAARARRRGLADRVTVVPRLDTRADVFSLMRHARVVVFPSLRESGGWVVAEAVAQGVPVVALDWGGPGQMLRSAGGSPVPVRGVPAREVVEQFAAAIRAAEAPANPDRWNRDRLPALMEHWWREAAGRVDGAGRRQTAE